MYERILIANDGSDGAAKALATALKLAHRLKAKLDMISVEEMSRAPATIDEVIEDKLEENNRYEQVIAQAQFRAKTAHVKLETHVFAGHAVSSIVEFIKTRWLRSAGDRLYGPLRALQPSDRQHDGSPGRTRALPSAGGQVRQERAMSVRSEIMRDRGANAGGASPIFDYLLTGTHKAEQPGPMLTESVLGERTGTANSVPSSDERQRRPPQSNIEKAEYSGTNQHPQEAEARTA